MSKADDDGVLTTRVGRISPTELSFAGYDVSYLLGHSYWQLVSMSVAGPELSPDDCLVLDRLTTCMLACDPRIWPLKVVQLAASYGDGSTGLAVGLMTMEPSPLSYWTAGEAARVLSELKARLGERPVTDAAELWRSERPPPGFGVYGRDADKRVSLFRDWRARSATEVGSHERLLDALEPVVRERCGQALRIDGLAGAVLTDLGFEPEQIRYVAGVVQTLPSLIANAYEGSRRGPSLRELPKNKVRYVGEPPRRSERARAHDAEASRRD